MVGQKPLAMSEGVSAELSLERHVLGGLYGCGRRR